MNCAVCGKSINCDEYEELRRYGSMRTCPRCNHEIDDEKAEFCPLYETQLPKELKEPKAVTKTKLPLIGGALLMAGAVTYTAINFAVPYDYMSDVFWFVLVIGFLLVPISILKRRNYGILVEFGVVTLFLEFWNVDIPNFYYYVNYEGALLGFLITLLGAFSVAASRQEFFD